MLTQFLAACLVTLIFFVLYGFGVLCYRLLFTKTQDEYPVKYYGKSKQRPVKGTKDIDVDRDQYSEIINDYPTLFTQDGVK